MFMFISIKASNNSGLSNKPGFDSLMDMDSDHLSDNDVNLYLNDLGSSVEAQNKHRNIAPNETLSLWLRTDTQH